MEMEENAMAMNDEPVRSKKHTRLHWSFSRISRAIINKLHVGGGHANTNDKSSSSSASFLSGCMHPRTHSFASRRRRQQATDANCGLEHEDDDDSALTVDFRSLRLGASAAVADEGGSSSSAQDYYTDDEMSGEDGRGNTPATSVMVAGGGVAVVTFSAAPYEDFRRSMREMVYAARRDAESAGSDDDARSPAVDWVLMEELLFCYLELNDRAVHRDILRAFTDTVATLRRSAGRWYRRRRRPGGRVGSSGGGMENTTSTAPRRRLSRRDWPVGLAGRQQLFF